MKKIPMKKIFKKWLSGLDKSAKCAKIPHADAGIAHPVERHLAKVEVASSSLVARSIERPAVHTAGLFIPAAGMMKLADMQDLGSCAARRWGSSPHARTTSKQGRKVMCGTSTATSTGDLVFPFPSQTHFVGLYDGIGSDLHCPGAPKTVVFFECSIDCSRVSTESFQI